MPSITSAPPNPGARSNYFFKMSAHFEWLQEHIHANPDFIRPERYRNEVLGMLREESGLGDLSISRPKSRLDWGIELPFDRDYVCYVWFDALINYLTAIGYPDGPTSSAFWGAVGALHRQGHPEAPRDLLAHHAARHRLSPYRHLNVHGYWNMDSRKVSKSLGNMVSTGDARQVRLRELPLLPAARDGFGSTPTSPKRVWWRASTPTWPTTSETW